MFEVPPPTSPQERIDRLRLIRTQNVGPVSFRQLLGRFGSAAAALEALPDLARRDGIRGSLQVSSAENAEREAEAVIRLGGRQVILGDTDYPRPLAATPDAPPVLSVLGDVALLNGTCIAMVGTRNASTNGRRFAEGLARELSAGDAVVVSGLARGIDAAVLAGGVDNIYPKENTELYEAIREQGAIVSEMPPGTTPQARHFPTRNRIISGLSWSVVVVEAALRSGSLITARLAGEQGREVFAVPGSPLDPRSRGANALIRNGAILIESAEDIFDGIRPMLSQEFAVGKNGLWEEADPGADSGRARETVLECLGPTPVSVDVLLRDSRLPAATVWSVLLELELAGRLERQPGGRVALLI